MDLEERTEHVPLVSIAVTRKVELHPLEVPDTVFQEPDGAGLQGANVPLDKLGDQAVHALVEDFIKRFYTKAGVRNEWQRRNYR